MLVGVDVGTSAVKVLFVDADPEVRSIDINRGCGRARAARSLLVVSRYF